ncbi:MAG: 3'(2'),5'-bisphosphate nucleotidase CysQ, partial [Saprospiraceae bacterium]|nr:3'(2'),5'-bisphosphate nucleotidase CysQ [Saprospiraceae bacterium]
MNEINTMIQEVVSIARQAGNKIMEIYEDVENFNVELKDDKSPLTRADKEANDIICNGLDQLKHKLPIISEENKEIPYAERKTYDYMWMVDPLDGTKEFIKRNGEFTVNIALIHENESIAGVVYAPAKDEMYYAVRSEGAYRELESGPQ